MANDQEKLTQQLKSVSPSSVINYLDKKGWVEAEPRQYIPNTKTFILSEVQEIIIPTLQNYQNYHMMLGVVINNLANIERRPQGEILKDIQGINKPLKDYKVTVEFTIASDISTESFNNIISKGLVYGVNLTGSQYKGELGKTLKVLENTVVVKV